MIRFRLHNRGKRRTVLYGALIAIALMAACARVKAPGVKPAFAPALPAPVSVAGRSVCIDPGHGGSWSGAISPHNQVRESDVNLRVAHRVKELLGEAGVHVSMTRESDVALVPDGLAQDLSARAAFANASGADLFVSIHHNADIKKDSTKNDLEVYYKLGDDGPSLDLAQRLIAHLSDDVRKDDAPKRLLPGNYKVLRECALPCVLLETSYLTEPRNAERMANADGIEAEARSIAAGIVTYFQSGPPSGVRVHGVIETAQGLHISHISVGEGAPVDPDTIVCFVDNTAFAGRASVTPAGADWSFLQPLKNGERTIEFRFRNTKGMAASASTTITVDRKPAALVVEQVPSKVPKKGMSEFLLVARPTDAFGIAVADGVQVRLPELGKTAVCQDGLARFYVPIAGLKDTVHVECEGVSGRHKVLFGEKSWAHVNLLDAVSKKSISGVRAIAGGAIVSESTIDGWIALPRRDGMLLVRNGYPDSKTGIPSDGSTIALKPLFKGALIDRRIVIDPAHGGRDPGLVGPSGLRGSDANLDVARRLAAMLEKAGAHVMLTRDGDVERTEPERVLDAERFKPDVFLTITFGSADTALRVLDSDGHQIAGESSLVAHYPGSENGKRLAEHIAGEIGITAIRSSVSYPVQQMSCPAVLVYPRSIVTPDAEASLGRIETRVDSAKGIAVGLTRWFDESIKK
jgi:N-acetylmuramoyl-L-alanine amidase